MLASKRAGSAGTQQAPELTIRERSICQIQSYDFTACSQPLNKLLHSLFDKWLKPPYARHGEEAIQRRPPSLVVFMWGG